MLAGQTDGRDTLANGTVLRDYTVEALLGRGGFGIVYKARHNELDLVVAIKEYLPSELAVRESATVRAKNASCKTPFTDGLRRFRDEAKALIDFQNHPNVIDCRDFFRLNGTAYLVMEYADGLPLSELLREREEERKPFGELELLAVMVPLLEGLTRVHKAEVLHRDIKPSNILVSRSLERPVLIDFGAAKQGVADRSKSLAPYTEGYAALEHVGDGKLGPWTDVYALGAVMWRMVAGGNRPWEPPNPVKVETRASAALRGAVDPMPSARELGAGRISPGILEAIDCCLTLNDGERVRGCGELLELLRGAGPAKEEAGSEPRDAPPVPVSTRQAQAGQKNVPRVVLAAGVAAAAFLVWFLMASRGGADPAGVDAESSSRAGAEQSRVSDRSKTESQQANTEVSRRVEEEVAGIERTDSPGQAWEASRRKEAARAAWDEVKGSVSPTVLAAYIAQWEHTDGAAEFVSEARVRSRSLAKIRAVKEEEDRWLKSPGRQFQDCAFCPQMVTLPAGNFVMGSLGNERGREGDEGPQHRVTILEPFAVGIYEVTFEEWEACVLDRSCSRDPSDAGWGRGRRPVIHMSWVDTQEYVTWISRKTGKQYRLLSEAEWEYAARAGTQTRYSFGNQISRDQANYDSNSSRIFERIKKTDRVGSYPPNRFGLHDMHGNVWEWVQDCWNDSYAGAPDKGQAWLSGICSHRVLRGGSWFSDSDNLRSADRYWGPIRGRVESERRGFRVARALDP